MPAGRLKQHRGDVESLFAEITSENRTLARRLFHARRVGHWLAAPLPRFAVRRRWDERVIPIGKDPSQHGGLGSILIGPKLRLRKRQIAERYRFLKNVNFQYRRAFVAGIQPTSPRRSARQRTAWCFIACMLGRGRRLLKIR